jgi:hypothetical protein
VKELNAENEFTAIYESIFVIGLKLLFEIKLVFEIKLIF